MTGEINFDINSPRSGSISEVFGLIGVGTNNDGILLNPSTIDSANVQAALDLFITEQRTPGVFFVSKDGSLLNPGTSLRDSVPTVAKAVQLANAYVSADSARSAIILIYPGLYEEVGLPLRVKRNISIYGKSLRGVELKPAAEPESNKFNTFFKVDSGFKAWGLTIAGLQADDTRQAWCFEFDEQANNAALGANSLGAFITKSPYIQNCTSYTAEDNKGEGGSESTGNTGGGLKVDGNACAINSPLRSFVVDSFTQINLGGPGCLVTNDGYAQLVSFFGTFCTYHCKAEKGGQVNFTGGTSDFGEYGLIADGFSPSAIFTARARREHYGGTRVSKVATVNASTNTFTSTNHGFINGDRVTISSTPMPYPIVKDVIYYIISAQTNTFQVSSTLNGIAEDITDVNGNVSELSLIVSKEGEFQIECINFSAINRLGLDSRPYNGTLAFPVLVFPRAGSLASSSANKATVVSVSGTQATANLNNAGAQAASIGTHEYVGSGLVTVTRLGADVIYPVRTLVYDHITGSTTFTADNYTPVVGDSFFFSNAEFICPRSAYTVVSSVGINSNGVEVSVGDPTRVGYKVNIYSPINGGLLYPIAANQKIEFRRRSQITAPAHVFEFVGSGTNYRALPDNGGVPNQARAYQEINNGRVFISWTNEKGDFGVSDKFLVDGTTGEVSINTSSFNLSGLNQIGPFSRNGGISTVGVVLKEFSDNPNLISSLGFPDNNTAPTQNAVFSYINNIRKFEGGDGTVTAPSFTNFGDNNTGLFFPAEDTLAFTRGGSEAFRINPAGITFNGAITATTKIATSNLVIPYSLIVAVTGVNGFLSTGEDKEVFYSDQSFTLTGVRATLTSAPLDSSVIIDIKVNGSSILASPRLVIPSGQLVSNSSPSIITSSFSINSRISINIDQVGATSPGQGLKVYFFGVLQ